MEGKDEEYFFNALLKSMGLQPDVDLQIRLLQGKERIIVRFSLHFLMILAFRT